MLSVGTQIVVMLGRRITEQYYIKTHTYDDYVNTQLSPTRIAKWKWTEPNIYEDALYDTQLLLKIYISLCTQYKYLHIVMSLMFHKITVLIE